MIRLLIIISFLLFSLEIITSLTLSSTSFNNNAEIKKKYTSYGENISPELKWSNAPAGTKSFALIVDDPDA